jgi:RNA polymerase sigma-70 factor (ECF subfamily)
MGVKQLMIAQAVNITQTSPYHLSVDQLKAEEELIKAAQKDRNMFGPLYRSYYPRIISFVYQRVDDHETAHEITSQVFYAALENLDKYRSQGVPFGAWLFRIALNKLNELFRKNKLQRTINIDSEGLHLMMEEMSEREDPLIDKKLFDALAFLDREELDMIDMRFFESRSFKEISEITGLGESACKMRIYRTLEKLKSHLKRN